MAAGARRAGDPGADPAGGEPRGGAGAVLAAVGLSPRGARSRSGPGWRRRAGGDPAARARALPPRRPVDDAAGARAWRSCTGSIRWPGGPPGGSRPSREFLCDRASAIGRPIGVCGDLAAAGLRAAGAGSASCSRPRSGSLFERIQRLLDDAPRPARWKCALPIAVAVVALGAMAVRLQAVGASDATARVERSGRSRPALNRPCRPAPCCGSARTTCGFGAPSSRTSRSPPTAGSSRPPKRTPACRGSASLTSGPAAWSS